MSTPELQRAADKLLRSVNGNLSRLAMLAAQYQAAAGDRPSGPLMVSAGVSALSRKPYVQLAWGENRGQVDVDTARAFAQNVLEACTNAVADAAIMGWAIDELDVGLERSAHLIDALRRYRADRWGQPDLALELEQPAPEEDE
jgi:hypothetical protein